MSDTPFEVTIEERDEPHHKVTAELSDKPPVPREGGGGWEVVTLPKRASVTIWKGRGLMQMQLPIVFDHTHPRNGRAPSGTIEGAITVLTDMWRPNANYNGETPPPAVEPPVLQISSPGDVVPFTGYEWVIEDLEWGTAVANEAGERVQQQMVVTLREYRADERLQNVTQEHKKRKRRTRYKIQRKDLIHGLKGIAEKLEREEKIHFGGWKELAKVNKRKLDPRLTGKDVGKWLTIPTKAKR
jgi:hypothetical protein